MKRIFDIELIGLCNAKCPFCPQSFNPNGVQREERFWNEELVVKVMNEIKEIAIEEPEGVHIEFCGIGEPLLKKDLLLKALEILFDGDLDKEFVQYKNEMKPIMDVRLTTNGFYLTEELVANPLFQRLNKIEISISPTLDKKKYETIYRIDYDVVKKNVMDIKSYYNGQVKLTGVKTKQFRDEWEDFTKFWSPYIDYIDMQDFHTRGGSYEHPAEIKEALRKYPNKYKYWPFPICGLFKYITFIDSAGYVLPCCHDVKSINKLGNVKEETLKSIFSKKEKMHKTEPGFEICKGCDDGMLEGGPNTFIGDTIEYDLDIHKPTTEHKYEYKIDDDK